MKHNYLSVKVNIDHRFPVEDLRFILQSSVFFKDSTKDWHQVSVLMNKCIINVFYDWQRLGGYADFGALQSDSIQVFLELEITLQFCCYTVSLT